jgi:hypothetical protein
MTADILFIESDVPGDLTLRDWRRQHAEPHRRHRVRRVVRRALGLR